MKNRNVSYMGPMRPRRGTFVRTLGLGLGCLLISAVAIAGPWEGGKDNKSAPAGNTDRRGGDSLGRSGDANLDLNDLLVEVAKKGGDSLGRAGDANLDLNDVLVQVAKKGGDSLGRFAGPAPEASSVASMQVFPNPTQGAAELRISCAECLESAYTLTMVDLTGKQVQPTQFASAQNAGTIHLDMQNLPAGVYYVVLQSGTQRLSTRIIKQ